MNEEQFISLLEQLKDTDWQSIVDGSSLLLIDDQRLEVGSADASNVVLCAPEQAKLNASALKEKAISKAAELLVDYYQTNPLSEAGFTRQAEQRIQQYGAEAFSAQPGQLPQCSLFVEGGEVIADGSDSPRLRYGVYLTLQHLVSEGTVDDQVRQWLVQGDANEDYLGMNVCRYNC
jgi:hypothetical protein